MKTKIKIMDKTKFYLNLSKCTEEQIKALPKIFEYSGDNVLLETLSDLISGKITEGFKFLFYSPSGWNQNDYPLNGRTELTYPEFIKLFEGGEGETSFKNYIENQRKEFARFVSENYTVDKHLQLRTQIDSLLIAYDQMQNKLNSNQ